MFQKIWTSDMVESHIFSTHSNGEKLNSHYYATRYPGVYAAAVRIFGSWSEAISACGFDYTEIRKYKVWDKNRITNAIAGIGAAGGALSSQKIQLRNKALYMAAIRHFGSWGAAVEAAGICYTLIRERRSLSPVEIREAIVKLYRAGVDLSYCNMRKNYQYLLAYGMKKLGAGSWAAARKACGVRTNYRIPAMKRRKKLVESL